MKKIACIITVICTQALFGFQNVENESDIVNFFPKTEKHLDSLGNNQLDQFYSKISKIQSISNDERNYENTVSSFDDALGDLQSCFMLYEGLAEVFTDNNLKNKASSWKKKISDIRNSFLVNASDFYEYFTLIQQQPDLTEDQMYYIDLVLRQLKFSGSHLEASEQKKLKELNENLSTLFNEFRKNISTDTRAVLASNEELNGFSPSFITKLKKREDSYLLTMDYPTFQYSMKYAENDALRRKLFTCFNNVGEPGNTYVLKGMMKYRDQLAKLLGFKSYTELEHSLSILQSSERAHEFLDNLESHSIPLIDRDLNVIASWKKQEKETILPLNVYDIPFIGNKIRQEIYDVDMKEFENYFPLESTFDGLLSIYEQFFDLKMKRVKIDGLWEDNLDLLQVYNNDEKLIGQIVLDIFPRQNKYTHACSLNILPGTKDRPALCMIIMNFTPPTNEKPSLLSFNEMVTLFHEIGHSLHDILGVTPHKLTCGTAELFGNRDFAELPSQLLEYWLEEKEILKNISCHYITGEKIPDEFLDKFIASNNLFSGIGLARQCLISRLALIDYDEGEEKDPVELFEQVFNEDNDWIVYPKDIHFQSRFGHLEEYGSMYYGYLLSRVFAVDVFQQIKKEGLLSKEAGKRYKDAILGNGAGCSPMKMIKDYLGRDPKVDFFIDSLK